jgi:hypothetical protein
VLRDVGVELRLPPDRDQIGLLVLKNGIGLLRLTNRNCR